MKKGDIVLGHLVPTDQDAPEAVQPTVCALHHTTPGFETSLPFNGLSLLAPTTDVGCEAGTDARGVQRFPLAAGTENKEDAIGAGAVGNPGAAVAEPMGVPMLGYQGLQHFPEFVGYLESAGGGIGPGGWASSLPAGRLGVFRFGHCSSRSATPPWLPVTCLRVSSSY